MGKGRDKKKKKKLASNPSGAEAKKQRKLSQGEELKKSSKKSKMLVDSSDDEDLDAILESFKAKVKKKFFGLGYYDTHLIIFFFCSLVAS